MIKYALQCDFGHGFEGWFSASADYEDQRERQMIECPFCGSYEVSKQIMAPAVAGTKSKGAVSEPTPQMRQMMMAAMGEVRRHVEANFDYVGDTFAREARDIHEGRSEERGIYGEASTQEVRALAEDGISVAPLPPKPQPKEKLN